MIAREQITIEDKSVSFAFKYPPPPEKDELKSLFAARWNPEKKIWSCRKTQDLLDWLSAQDLLDGEIEIPSIPTAAEDAAQPDHFAVALRPYQRAGASFLENMPGAILGDEMGLGKTLQALAGVRKHLPALIVCPLIAKSVWAREIKKALPERSMTVLDSKVSKFSRHQLDADFLIVNYDILKKWADTFAMMTFQSLICDEAHYLKSTKSQRTKEVLTLSERIEKKILITGTPVLNRPIELYSLLNILDLTYDVEPGGFWAFAMKYCGGYRNRFSGNWETKDASNLTELHRLVAPYMVRRLKKNVLTDLPEKTIMSMDWHLPSKDLAEYNYCARDFREWYLATHPELEPENLAGKPLGLMQLGALKRLSAEAKIPAMADWLQESFVPEGKKAIIFSDYRYPLSSLHQTFKDQSVLIWGGQSQKEREASEYRFQNDPNILFCFGQTRAAGVALTLTAADTAIFLTMPWTPGEFNQAADRIHRIGQTNAVSIIVPITTRMDEMVYQAVAGKEEVVNAVIDGDGASLLASTERQIMANVAEALGIQLTREEMEVENEEAVMQ